MSVDGDPHTKQVVVTMRDGHGGVTAVEAAITRLGPSSGRSEMTGLWHHAVKEG